MRFLTAARTVTLAACAVAGAMLASWLFVREVRRPTFVFADTTRAVYPVIWCGEQNKCEIRYFPQRIVQP